MAIWTNPILVKVRANKLYAVDSADLLVADSSVLDELITKQGQHEIDMADFEPETVILFLTSLEGKAIDSIDDLHFHDLLRLSVEFNVQWLTKECHKHFATKISSQEQRCLKGEWEYSEMESIWEECKSMVTKWGDPYMVFVDLFVKTAKELNHKGHKKFVEEFVKRDLTPLEINVILRSAEICTLGFVMKALLEDIKGNEQLTEKSKLLLENLNMALCKIHCREDYNKMVGVVASRFLSMTPEDMKLVFDVVRDSSGLPPSKDISQENEVFDYKWMQNKFFPENNPVPITQVAEDTEMKSANTLVDYILHMLLGFEGDIQQLDEIEDVCKELEEICSKKDLNRAHRPYIRSSINLLKNINVDMWDGVLENYTRLLNLIEYSEILSSEYDNVTVECRGNNGGVFNFWFAHPGVNEESCAWKGTKCGFLLENVESKIQHDSEDQPVDGEVKVEVRMKFIRTDSYRCKQGGEELEENTTAGDQEDLEENTTAGDTSPEFLRKMSEKVEIWKAALGRSRNSPKSNTINKFVCIKGTASSEDPGCSLDVHCHDLISAADMSLLYTKLEVENLENPGEGFTAMLPVTLSEVVTSLLSRSENYKVSGLTSTGSGSSGNPQFVIYNIANCLVKKRCDHMTTRVHVEDANIVANIVANVVANASHALHESGPTM